MAKGGGGTVSVPPGATGPTYSGGGGSGTRPSKTSRGATGANGGGENPPADWIVVVDEKLKSATATVTAQTDAKLAEVRSDMKVMKNDLVHEIDQHSKTIETKLERHFQQMPGWKTIWGAAATIVVALIATVGTIYAISVSAFSAGTDSVSGSADRAADARQGIERLTDIAEQQQQQINQIGIVIDRLEQASRQQAAPEVSE